MVGFIILAMGAALRQRFARRTATAKSTSAVRTAGTIGNPLTIRQREPLRSARHRYHHRRRVEPTDGQQDSLRAGLPEPGGHRLPDDGNAVSFQGNLTNVNGSCLDANGDAVILAGNIAMSEISRPMTSSSRRAIPS